MAACFIHEFLIWFRAFGASDFIFNFLLELGEHHEELTTPFRKCSWHVHVDVFTCAYVCEFVCTMHVYLYMCTHMFGLVVVSVGRCARLKASTGYPFLTLRGIRVASVRGTRLG